MFFKKILELAGGIPYGRVTTYGEIALAVESPKASRAVGNVLHMIITPRYPAIGWLRAAGWGVGGYNRGVDEKIALLMGEGVLVKEGVVHNFKEVLFRFPPSVAL